MCQIRRMRLRCSNATMLLLAMGRAFPWKSTLSVGSTKNLLIDREHLQSTRQLPGFAEDSVLWCLYTAGTEQSMWAERERRKSRSALQPISAPHAPHSVPAPLPFHRFLGTPAPRSAPLHPIFGLLSSVFRSAHMLWDRGACSSKFCRAHKFKLAPTFCTQKCSGPFDIG